MDSNRSDLLRELNERPIRSSVKEVLEDMEYFNTVLENYKIKVHENYDDFLSLHPDIAELKNTLTKGIETWNKIKIVADFRSFITDHIKDHVKQEVGSYLNTNDTWRSYRDRIINARQHARNYIFDRIQNSHLLSDERKHSLAVIKEFRENIEYASNLLKKLNQNVQGINDD